MPNPKPSTKPGQVQRDHVIEPFAGSAGYSVYWEPKRVTLVELDPVVAGVWQYLIKVKPAEIMRLPVNIDSLDELPAGICQEARDLIGFGFDKAGTTPAKRRQNWVRQKPDASSWGERNRARVAFQVPRIKHWRIIHGDYRQAPDVEAHWHVDPPYTVAGKTYRVHDLDYVALAQWCRKRKGFTQVCENLGADWLPFRVLGVASGSRASGLEAVWINEIEMEYVE